MNKKTIIQRSLLTLTALTLTPTLMMPVPLGPSSWMSPQPLVLTLQHPGETS